MQNLTALYQSLLADLRAIHDAPESQALAEALAEYIAFIRDLREAQMKTMKQAADFDTRDNARRHSIDMLLRRHGYRIASRPAKGEAWWIKGGVWYPQSEAVLAVQREEEGINAV